MSRPGGESKGIPRSRRVAARELGMILTTPAGREALSGKGTLVPVGKEDTAESLAKRLHVLRGESVVVAIHLGGPEFDFYPMELGPTW